eukprot:1673026-Alexandrium_andersonii.AAC.1
MSSLPSGPVVTYTLSDVLINAVAHTQFASKNSAGDVFHWVRNGWPGSLPIGASVRLRATLLTLQ